MKYLVNPVPPFASNAPGTEGAEARVFTIASEHSSLVLTLRDETNLAQVPGSLVQVSVGADGSVWGVDEADQIFKWTGSTWTQVDGALRQISVGSAEHVWGVDAEDRIFRFTGATWEQVPGQLKQVAAASDGTVWGVGGDQEVFFRRGNAWESIPGPLSQVAVGARTNVWGVDAAGDVFVRGGSEWVKLPTSKLKRVSVAADGSVWGIDQADQLQRWRGGEFETVPGALAQISVGSASDVWGIDGSGQIMRNVGTFKSLVIQALWVEDTRQQWRFVRQADGTFMIQSVHNGLVLDIRGKSKSDGADLLGFPSNNQSNQRWLVSDLEDGRFRIDAKHSGKSLAVFGRSLEAGAQIVQSSWEGLGEQRWRLAEVRPSAAIFDESATLYQNNSFGGTSVQLGVGRFGSADLGPLGNDKLSSLKVPRGLRVTLFKNADFQGPRKPFTADAGSVGSDFDNTTSAVVVEKVATIYTNANFQGTASSLGIGNHNVDALGIPNDSLSSLRVPQGLVVILYEHRDLKGRQWIYFEDTPRISVGFDNKTSSIAIRKIGIEIPRDSVRFGGHIQLRGDFGMWLVAEDDRQVNANRPFARSLETFTVERNGPSQHTSHVAFGDVVALRTARGRYIASESDGTTNNNSSQVDVKERWVIVRNGATRSNVFVSHGDVVSLRSWRDHFLEAEADGGTNANSPEPGPSTRFTITGYSPPNQVAAQTDSDGTQIATGQGPCGAAVCAANVCAVEACNADACAAEACSVDSAIVGACSVAAAGFAVCASDVSILSACGAAVTGVGACGAAACGAAVCGAAATGFGVCGAELAGVGVCGAAACGAAACGADACGVAACGAEACGAAACGVDANPVDACGADGAGIDVCPADVCGANVCGLNLCPADACAADACAIDIIPIIPGI